MDAADSRHPESGKRESCVFLVGVNAEHYPGLVRRIVDEGHEIGNHTYYHPNLALCWPEHIRLELNATQLLLETITGRSTTLFRPPYAADTSPSQLSELIPLKIAQDLGYLVVLENIDPQDWAQARRRHHRAARKTAAPRWQYHSAARCRRRSFADRRSAAAHSRLSPHARRHCRLVKHAAGHDARCVDAAGRKPTDDRSRVS